MKRVVGLLACMVLSSCQCNVEALSQIPPKDDPPLVDDPLPEGTGAVEGRVCAPDGHTWLVEALVRIEIADHEPLETVSDVDGHYRLEDVPAGPQMVLIQKGSFHASRDVLVQSGHTVTIPEDACLLDSEPHIAVVRGSQYDNVEAVLDEIGIEASAIDVYGDDWARQLLATDDGLDGVDILFLNCRSNERDFAASAAMQERLRTFVERGGSLHASDQAYDLIEIAFPDKINFLGDDEVRGAADQGKSVDELDAQVLNPNLVVQLNEDVIPLHYGLSTWSVMASVAPDVEIYLRADAPLLDGGVIDHAPQIVGFNYGEGRVLYSSFHQEPGIGYEQELVLKLILFEL